jgi:signal transduction histidine kinase/PAS domain-containing protein
MQSSNSAGITPSVRERSPSLPPEELALLRAEAERHSQEMEAVFASLHDAALIYDTAMNVVRASPSFLATYRFDPAGLNVKDVIARVSCRWLDGRPFRLEDQPTPRALRGEQVTGARYLITPPGGEEMIVETSSAPLRVGGRIVGSVTVWHDITEMERTADELRRLNRTLRALTNANQALLYATNELDYLNEACRIIVEDCGHAMVWVGYAENDQAKNVRPVASAGFEEGYLETLKLTWADSERGRGPTGMAIRTGQVSVCRNMLTDPRFAPWREQALRRGYRSSIVFPMLSEGRAFGALTIYSREPDPFSEAEVNLLTELTNDLTYGVNVLRLQAERKRTEAERDELLQREQAARAEAEAAVRIRDHFITLASHELKTPLTSLMGYAELLMRRVQAAGLSEQDARMVQTIFRQTSRLEKMISALLDISRIERGQLGLEPEPVDLAALIASTLEEIEPSLRRHTFEFIHPDEKVIVNADRARLEQVLENLVQNAIKYSPSGGPVSVRLTQAGGAARITVRDEGIGIPAAAMPHLFTRFYRAENADANHIGGLGVGLSIARDIIRRHGGDITVTSREGIGSEFTVSLPLM